MVGHALDEGALRRFLTSDSPADWDKAGGVLRHVTAVRWVKHRDPTKRQEPETVVEDYWLKALISTTQSPWEPK